MLAADRRTYLSKQAKPKQAVLYKQQERKLDFACVGGIWAKGPICGRECPYPSNFDARPSTLGSKMLMTNGLGVHEWSPQDQQFVLFDGQGQTTTPPMQVKLGRFNEDIFL